MIVNKLAMVLIMFFIKPHLVLYLDQLKILLVQMKQISMDLLTCWLRAKIQKLKDLYMQHQVHHTVTMLIFQKLENMIGNPLSPYAVTKLVNEHYASVFAKNYNFKTIGLRYFNIFGKRQDPNGAYAAVIPKWISSILNKESVYINGDGETSRDFCYIDNAVQTNILAAMTENSDATDQVYNVALNDRTSLNELYRMIEDTLIKNVKGLEKKEPIYRDFRPGDVRHSQASINKAKELLNYEPQFRIAEGLNEAIGWYINSLK